MDRDKIKEICSYLDVEVYGKQCNFLDDYDNFYSRDYCYNINFRELIKWYIERINYTEEEAGVCERGVVNTNIEYLMELIDIYSVYRIMKIIRN